MPPAFTLSQDQTLQLKNLEPVSPAETDNTDLALKKGSIRRKLLCRSMPSEAEHRAATSSRLTPTVHLSKIAGPPHVQASQPTWGHSKTQCKRSAHTCQGGLSSTGNPESYSGQWHHRPPTSSIEPDSIGLVKRGAVFFSGGEKWRRGHLGTGP